jgi:DNA polymerase-3 subunit beta
MRAIVKDSIEIKEPGGVALLAVEISSIFRESPDESLVMETEGTQCHIRGAKNEYRVIFESPDDFPPFPAVPEAEGIEVEAAVLSEMIKKTRFAAANEAMRYALNGVFFSAKKGDKSIEMVGADGRRLAQIKRKASSASSVDIRAIISLKALAQMEKIVLGVEGSVKLSFAERQVWLTTDGVTLVAQLVEGHYPNYEEVIPDDCDKKAITKREELMSGVRQAAVVGTDESHAVSFQFKPNVLLLTSESPERGSSKVEVEVEYSGPETQIWLDPDFILDMLKVTEDESVVFEFKESSRPAILRSGRNYQYLVMPMSGGAPEETSRR